MNPLDTALRLHAGRMGEMRAVLEADNTEFRNALLASEPALTAIEVGPAASQWQRTGAIFSVPANGTERYFAFQFRDGQPHPTIGKVLAVLPDGFSPWQRAAWFVSANGWLDDDAPRDRIDEPDLLVAAARLEAEDPIG